MSYLDELIPHRGTRRRFPWEVVALEHPELIALIAELVAHGLLATAVARELHERGWFADEERRPELEDAIHRRFVNRRTAVGPYAPYVSLPVGVIDPTTPAGAALLAAHRGRERDPGLLAELVQRAGAAGQLACAACGAPPGDSLPLDCHHDVPVSAVAAAAPAAEFALLCPACHNLAHRRLPPYVTSELRALRAARQNGSRPARGCVTPGTASYRFLSYQPITAAYR